MPLFTALCSLICGDVSKQPHAPAATRVGYLYCHVFLTILFNPWAKISPSLDYFLLGIYLAAVRREVTNTGRGIGQSHSDPPPMTWLPVSERPRSRGAAQRSHLRALRKPGVPERL